MQANSVRLLIGVEPLTNSVIVVEDTPSARPAAALDSFITRNQMINSLRVIYSNSRKVAICSELVSSFLGIMARLCENVKTQQGNRPHILSRSACFGR